MSLQRDKSINIATGYRYQWEPAQNSHVLLYPEGMINLNESAATILGKVDDQRSADDIISSLKIDFPDADLENDVIEFLEIAIERGWINVG
ncbi:MAG: pyrroloquinoline quinone biosynthesis peptide chaperone PqqD [Gammaproteobacteria bacterium]|nr:pyrroloquinoline quinone biosynthesis peptide chaperone PqqD [Gammaproteobacteria bacterium]